MRSRSTRRQCSPNSTRPLRPATEKHCSLLAAKVRVSSGASNLRERSSAACRRDARSPCRERREFQF